MRFPLVAAAAVVGCTHYDYHTRAFVAATPCGQGPYEFAVTLEGTHEQGIEVYACTPRRLAGYAQISLNKLDFTTDSFGDVADNARCTGGRPTTVTSGGAAGGSGGGDASGGVATPSAPLVERAFVGPDQDVMSEDELCRPYGVPGQRLSSVLLGDDDLVHAGSRLRVRIWSDTPNDLERVVFLVRDVHTSERVHKAKYEVAKPGDPVPPPPRDHGVPPAPLAEERPVAPSARATWVSGYWTWTGSAWGWSAGFWRDERVALPAPRIEVPGAPPSGVAVWVVGGWQLRAGSWVWIRGRWR